MKKEFLSFKISLILGILFSSVASENEWKCFINDKNNKYVEVYADNEKIAVEKVSKRLDVKSKSIKCYREEYFERKYEKYEEDD